MTNDQKYNDQAMIKYQEWILGYCLVIALLEFGHFPFTTLQSREGLPGRSHVLPWYGVTPGQSIT